MTAEQLLDHNVVELMKMSDDELTKYVAELIPQARAEYAGRVHTSDTLLLPNGKRMSMKQAKKDNETMLNILKLAGLQPGQQI